MKKFMELKLILNNKLINMVLSNIYWRNIINEYELKFMQYLNDEM